MSAVCGIQNQFVHSHIASSSPRDPQVVASLRLRCPVVVVVCLCIASPHRPLRASMLCVSLSSPRLARSITRTSSLSSCRSFCLNSTPSSVKRPVRGPYNVLFCGSDEFASTILEHLVRQGEGTAWKSLTLLSASARAKSKPLIPAPAVKTAQRLGISVHQTPFDGIPAQEAQTQWQLPAPFSQGHPESLLITASFGQMVPDWTLDRFTQDTSDSMALNVHPSRLPDLRGAAPIQWAIARHYRETGVTVQQLSRGKFDHGHILAQTSAGVPPGATYESLMPDLAQRGARLLLETILELPARHDGSQPQSSEKATLAPKLDRRHAEIDWEQMAAEDIEARHRAFRHSLPLQSWLQDRPGKPRPRNARVLFRGVSLPSASSAPERDAAFERLANAPPGSTTLVADGEQHALLVKTSRRDAGHGKAPQALLVTDIQTESKKRMSPRDWWNGQGDRVDADKLLHFGLVEEGQEHGFSRCVSGPSARPSTPQPSPQVTAAHHSNSMRNTTTSTHLADAPRRIGRRSPPALASKPLHLMQARSPSAHIAAMGSQAHLYSTLTSTPINTASMTPSPSGGKPPRRRGTLAKAIGDGSSWSQLHPAQKVFRTGYKTGQIGLVVGGAALTGAVLWALLSEMFAPNSPSVIYKDACKRVENCPEIYDHLLRPLRFHVQPISSYTASYSPVNPPSGSRRRSSHLPVSTVVTERASGGEREVLMLRFYLEARDKDRDWTYVEKAREVASDAWVTCKTYAEDWLENLREERSERPEAISAGKHNAVPVTAAKSASSDSGPSAVSRFLSSLSPLPSSRAASGILKRREPGTFSSGEVKAELVFDHESNKWQYRKLFVDVPKSGTLGATRVWIVRKEGEVKR
ncbi:unnamed protein product [Parajaminaea phylloscopi]